ncbi:MAG: DNA-binding transcriptional MerR regulator [Candidatus Marivariicella framensis]|jgi:DNA-binding transcriptional MerR regulator|tara:strand:- start:757 stop:1083 length:327 start_codon:yes stop_codon:yes gene_type:complete
MLVNLPEKLYYNIGEVANAFNVKPSLLRFWENEFDEIKPKKKESGTRKYTPEDIQLIQLIFHLVKEKGMTLDGAKKQLKQKKGTAAQQGILIRLEKIKYELKQILDQI